MKWGWFQREKVVVIWINPVLRLYVTELNLHNRIFTRQMAPPPPPCWPMPKKSEPAYTVLSSSHRCNTSSSPVGITSCIFFESVNSAESPSLIHTTVSSHLSYVIVPCLPTFILVPLSIFFASNPNGIRRQKMKRKKTLTYLSITSHRLGDRNLRIQSLLLSWYTHFSFISLSSYLLSRVPTPLSYHVS